MEYFQTRKIDEKEKTALRVYAGEGNRHDKDSSIHHNRRGKNTSYGENKIVHRGIIRSSTCAQDIFLVNAINKQDGSL